MESPIVQLLVLAGIAVFLILRLRSVLGTREGFEKPPLPRTEQPVPAANSKHNFEVIDGGPDRDIVDHVPEASPAAAALAEMKRVEPSFSVTEFLSGARAAYEMILMGFERGDLNEIRPFLSEEVAESFASVIDQRADEGLSIDATFVGIRELQLIDAAYDPATQEGEVTVRFVADLTWQVRDANDVVIDGDASQIKRQKDAWTFARRMGTDDPNWQLVATGE
ncbi:Tim44 domain-containing protein [Donghicola sp. C2-DW-16]|uniref:Tim44 domain-containing protein n=1 Tax=Donghicola mangrovi TaxID=2729614 RepID=A0A850Q032_9RHOB|nr:Tim44/TimA family putative adaptor protein [Donghicola mangrovi]NVO22393.1 Tim44 domain-containing protein [Donghicola mangrovi]NVO26016.1 Tim44 domain-containing protein [Donghicola mangrovi]